MLEVGWMGFEVVNLEREELFHPDLQKKVWVVGIKEIKKDRNGFWQVVLTACIVKEYYFLAFGQCSCGTSPAETLYWSVQWQKSLLLLQLPVLSGFHVLLCWLFTNVTKTWMSCLEWNKWWNPGRAGCLTSLFVSTTEGHSCLWQVHQKLSIFLP